MTQKDLKKLLFVDDDQDIVTIAKYCLEDLQGVDIKYLYSGKQAVEEALTFHPDLILIDMMMPGMDGLETMKAIRQLPTIAKTPIVFITAKLQQKEIDNYLALGAADVIKKPFDPITLAENVRTIWKKVSQ